MMNAIAPQTNPPAERYVTSSSAAGDGGILNLHQLIAIFQRRIRIFLAVVLCVCAAGAAYTLSKTPTYRAVATVMLNVRPENITTVKEVTASLDSNNATVQTEVEMLHSRQLAERVVSVLGLEKDPEFNPALASPGGIRQLIPGSSSRSKPKSAAARDTTADRPSVVDAVMSRLDVARVPDTYVINVGFESTSPTKAAKIANAFADRYLLNQVETKYGATEQASNWLSERLGQLRGEVETAEAAVEQYKVSNNLLSTSGASLTEQEISVYNQGVAAAKANQSEREARLRTAQAQLRAGSSGDDVGEALGSNVVQSLRAQRAQISGRVAEMATRYGPRHPEMIKAQNQLSDIDAQIQAEIKRIISNLEAEVEVSKGRTSTVQSSLYGAKGTLATTNRASVKLRELERNAEAVRVVYESFLNRYKETTSQQGLERTDGRVVSQAKVPSGQHSPNIPLNLALALAIGIGAGLIAIVLVEALSSGLATAAEVEQKLGLPLLASIPDLKSLVKTSLPPSTYVIQKPLSGFSESFRVLRSAVSTSAQGQPTKIVTITSALPGEGKTTTSLCLARTAALQGQKVLVIDCDLRRRGMTLLSGAAQDVGIVEVLDNPSVLAQAIVKDSKSDVDILPVSGAQISAKEVFDTPVMRKLLAEVGQGYDLVVLDSPPVFAVADARVLASMADVVVLVVPWRKTSPQMVNTAIEMLESAGASIKGVAMSKIDMKRQRFYGYGDATYYYGEYSKYYSS
jgi:succinoglycan biosynthesis transport protein ExoP